MRILHKKFTVNDGGEQKEFTIHKFKATEFIQVLRAILSCLAHTDIEFNDALGFAPAVLEAYAHLKLGTGVTNTEVNSEELRELQNAIRLRRGELLFYIFKLALKSLDKSRMDELIGYLVYALSIEEPTQVTNASGGAMNIDIRLTNASGSVMNIDNYISTGAALLLLCREVLEFNFEDFFLGFQKSITP